MSVSWEIFLVVLLILCVHNTIMVLIPTAEVSVSVHYVVAKRNIMQV